MDNLRLVLLFTLAAVLLLLYQAWVQDYGPIGGQPQVIQQQTTPPSRVEKGADSGVVPPTPDIPSTDTTPSTTLPTMAGSTTAGESGAGSTGTIRVETDLLSIEIARRGGAIISARLLDYPQTPRDQETKFRLLKPEPPNFFVVESGLRGPETGPLPADSRSLTFQATQESFTLKPGQDELEVVLSWSEPAGVEIHGDIASPEAATS